MLTTSELLKKVRYIEIRTRGLVNDVFSGEYHSVFKGRGMNFSEVREYQFGDDVRSIDWNVTARFDHPYVKVFEEERELTVLLLVDVSRSMGFGTEYALKRQIAAEISAIIAFSALKNNDKIGLLLFSGQVEKFVPPKKSKSHALRIVRDLLSVESEGTGSGLNNALQFTHRAMNKRSIIFILSDFFDTGYEKSLKMLAKKHDVVCISIKDRREKDFIPSGLMTVQDAETGRMMVIDTSSTKFRRDYLTQQKIREERLKEFLTSSGVDYIPMSGADYIKPLISFFKSREKRW